jgi:hypothetical protein
LHKEQVNPLSRHSNFGVLGSCTAHPLISRFAVQDFSVSIAHFMRVQYLISRLGKLPRLFLTLWPMVFGSAATAQITVSLTSPIAGATFSAPGTITLVASATPSDGASITNVQFIQGTTTTVRSKLLVLFSMSLPLGVVLSAPEESQGKKDDQVTLEPIAHKFYWESFSISKNSPVSPDGRYRLKKVAPDGSVELAFSPSPTVTKIIVVKPMPKSFEKGERPPTIVVAEANAKTQSATIKELRMK